MKIVDNEKFYTVGEIAEEVGKTPLTIKRWYEWAEKNNQLYRLPDMYRDFDERGTRYFKNEAIPLLILFGKSLERGEMAEFNRKFWGKRGKK